MRKAGLAAEEPARQARGMFEAFVIALREGVEAALVVALLLATLARTGRGRLRGAVYAGLAAAVAASLALAACLSSLGVVPEDERVEGALLLASALLVGSLVVWMARHGRRLKGTIERRVEAIAEPGRGARLGVFLFAFLMVGREGVELVLFLGAAALRADGALPLLAGLAGLALAVGLGVAFARGSLRVDLRRFFLVTTAMLLLFAVELLALAFHEFVEAGVIRPSEPERYMRAVGPLVRNRVLFAGAMILLPLAILLARARGGVAPAAAPENPAEARKRRAEARASRLSRASFAALAACAVLALGFHAAASARALERTPAVPVVAVDGEVRVPLAGLEERRLHRFGADVGDRIVRFLVWRDRGETKVALDACRLCRDLGYVQRGEHLLCLNCLAEIFPPSLGAEGGCNPIPVPHAVTAEDARIRLTDLEARKEWFAASEAAAPLECPSCGMRFRPEESGGSLERDGRTLPVCGMPECVRRAEGGK